jgi:ribonucleoside-diphosphate reductase alpha chain
MASAYANNNAHRDRMITYLHNYWFHPATPISSNGGTDRGFSISCFVGDVHDSKKGIFDAWNESGWLGAMGGGVGRYWGDVREMGAKVSSHGGTSSGVIPFMCVDGSLSRAVSQGGARRFTQADWLNINHPEIEEFLDIRKSTGDQNRRDSDLHHGVVITDAFMHCVIDDKPFNLISPKTGQVTKTINARELWTHLLDCRVTTGEPYIMFYDNVNNRLPKEYDILGHSVKLSNLCTEIFSHTSSHKTNVCDLGSLNLEYWDEYSSNIQQVVADCTDFLDNVMEDFINKARKTEGFDKAVNAAVEERNLGLGVMGWHSLLQKRGIPFESALAQSLNKSIFKAIREASDAHQTSLPEDSICPMSKQAGTHRRNILTMAIAPTMSISNLCDVASSGVEPWFACSFSKKLKQGTFIVKNKYLADIIIDYALSNKLNDDWIEEQWTSIKRNSGSVQHLEWLDDYQKDVFKTSFELDQRWVIQHAADRVDCIDQGQSINIFVEGNSNVQVISDLVMYAWSKGLKSLYYHRSTNPNKVNIGAATRKTIDLTPDMFADTCLGCT